jgi:hypothetical protein
MHERNEETEKYYKPVSNPIPPLEKGSCEEIQGSKPGRGISEKM